MKIDAGGYSDFATLNRAVRAAADSDVEIVGCIGRRYIAAGLKDKRVTVYGTPGNALGAYLDGGTAIVRGNAQDATGDTMNDGLIVVHGNAGDATGYAMRGGRIYVRGNTGYRAGIHMKEYADSKPVIVIGGSAGSFLGEYQAGGIIAVLGLGGAPVVNNFCATGMHGGKIYLRCESLPHRIPRGIRAEKRRGGDAELKAILTDYCKYFDMNADELIDADFFVLTPDADNPYVRMYVNN